MIDHGRISRYFHTLRYLRARQLLNRVWRSTWPLHIPKRDAPPLRAASYRIKDPVHGPQTLVGEGRFSFLNVVDEVLNVEDWNSSDRDRLWLYNVHYFDDLVATGACSRQDWHRKLIERWINENPVGFGCGWEPYPTSLRIVNWIKFHLLGSSLDSKAIDSLADQLRCLHKRIEYHLLGNHLIANAKAIFIGGCFFEGAEADKWKRVGFQILRQQLSEQVLPDGGHIERSPMYHSLVLEDLMDVANVACVYSEEVPSGMEQAIKRMLHWLREMTHPDGEVSMFNDSAFGIAPRLDLLENYADRLGMRPKTFPTKAVSMMADSGYARMEAERLTLLIDAAPIGPDYLPGHAHADTLSFECSIGKQRVFVNSGTSTYSPGVRRSWQRSTAAHNTVTVDQENSSEVWDAFRVARRARPLCVHADLSQGVVSAGHDGYQRLPGRVTHYRTWRLTKEGFRVDDKLMGKYSEAVGRLYLHPNVGARVDDGGVSGSLTIDNRSTVRWSVKGGTVRLHRARFFPEFGKEVDNVCLVIHFDSNEVSMKFFID